VPQDSFGNVQRINFCLPSSKYSSTARTVVKRLKTKEESEKIKEEKGSATMANRDHKPPPPDSHQHV
jgi:hypothetical protein